MSDNASRPTISVVTPTFGRPQEVHDLLACISDQTRLPDEVVIVDGAPPDQVATEDVVREMQDQVPFPVSHVRSRPGTAIQRNVGIEHSEGKLVALLDDDVRPAPDYLAVMERVFEADQTRRLGGLSGFRANTSFDAADRVRWRWYRRLGLLSVFDAGHYDWRAGYPVNTQMVAPFTGLRSVEVMSTAAAVWRREVFDEGLWFDSFFVGYGVLEDAHFSLRASKRWELAQCGDAVCVELHSPNARTDQRRIGYMQVVNFYYVFTSVAGPLSWAQQGRFWRMQAFEVGRMLVSAARRWRGEDLTNVRGRLDGMIAVAKGRAWEGQRG